MNYAPSKPLGKNHICKALQEHKFPRAFCLICQMVLVFSSLTLGPCLAMFLRFSAFAAQSLAGATRVGRTPKGAYSSRGRSRHLLETTFSEPLVRTLPRSLLTVKPRADRLLRTLLRTLPQNPFQNLLRTLLRTLCCRTAP